MASQTSCGTKVDTSICGIPYPLQGSAIFVDTAQAGVQGHLCDLGSLDSRLRGNDGGWRRIASAIRGRASKHEEDQERDGEAKKASRFGEREAEKREGLHLTLRGRVAGDRAYQRR